MGKRIAVIVGIGLLLLLTLFYSQWRTSPFQVSGFIEADEARVGSLIGGRVRAVHAVEGENVPSGGLLIELEPYDILARKAEAEAQLAQSQAEYERLQAGFRSQEILQGEAKVAQLTAVLEKLRNGPREEEITAAAREATEAEERYRLATADYQRIEELFGNGSVTREQFDQASSEAKAARAAWEARRARHELLVKGTRPEEIAEARARLDEAQAGLDLLRAGYREEDVEKAQAAVLAAQARLDALKEQIEELQIRGPQGWIIQAVDLQPGDLVGPGIPVISLLDPGRLWVRAYVPEDRLGIQLGQQVAIRVDSFPNETFPGEIVFIAGEAEFTPRNVQTHDERVKQVFRIKVELTEGLDRLRPGMAADVLFDTAEPSP